MVFFVCDFGVVVLASHRRRACKSSFGVQIKSTIQSP